jgi:LmbE family N-acetylglucosaminyl deacetylase
MNQSLDRDRMQKKFGLTAAIKPVPAGHRILVLAPHPDDETIGCGAALYMHSQIGCHIRVVFLTDGRFGRLTGMSEEETVLARRNEAQAAAAVLGIQEVVFWDYKDELLQCTAESVQRLRDELQEYQPELVYLPHVLDEHRDHWITNKIFIAAAQDTPLRNVLGYETWTPGNPNYLINITPVMDKKIEAINCYETQQRLFGIQNISEKLCAFRGARFRLKGFRYVEALVQASVAEYCRLCEVASAFRALDMSRNVCAAKPQA